jgi:hypothetical protein
VAPARAAFGEASAEAILRARKAPALDERLGDPETDVVTCSFVLAAGVA